MTPEHARKAGKRRRPRPPLPAPRWSSCLYLRIRREDVAMFRFLLEAEDNLAYMTVVDRWKTVLRVVFSPHQKTAVHACLERMRERVPFTLAYLPDEDCPL